MKRMSLNGMMSYSEKIVNHVYVRYDHFFELQNLIQWMAKGGIQKCFKFVFCQYEIDMGQRKNLIHESHESSCSKCRAYVDKMENKSIWWFPIEGKRYVKVTFQDYWTHSATFRCSALYIIIVGTFEVEVSLEESREGEYLRRSFAMVGNVKTSSCSCSCVCFLVCGYFENP